MNPDPNTVQEGVLLGGWTYIWASYLVTWVTFAGYAASLVWRARRAGGGEA